MMARTSSLDCVTFALLVLCSVHVSSHPTEIKHPSPLITNYIAPGEVNYHGSVEDLPVDVEAHVEYFGNAAENLAEHDVDKLLDVFSLTPQLEGPSFAPELTHSDLNTSHTSEMHSEDDWFSQLKQEEGNPVECTDESDNVVGAPAREDEHEAHPPPREKEGEISDANGAEGDATMASSDQAKERSKEGMDESAEVRRVLATVNRGIPHISGSVFGHINARLTFPDFRYAPQFILQGDASLHNGVIRLTSSSRSYSSGAAVLRTQAQLLGYITKPRRACANVPFATSFVYLVSGPTAGLTFFAALNPKNLGSAGSYLGWGGPKVHRHTSSFAIEFDVVKDPKVDPYPNHVGLDFNYAMKSTKISRELFGKARVRLGAPGVKKVWITYSQGILKVFVAEGQKAQLPKQPVLATPLDLCSFLPQAHVYLGFSASTGQHKGGSVELQRWNYVTPGISSCPSCVSSSVSAAVKCCAPFQCCFGYCLSPTELCGGNKCCGAPDSGRVCWGEQCCSSFSACLSPKGKQVCCPTPGDTTCCL